MTKGKIVVHATIILAEDDLKGLIDEVIASVRKFGACVSWHTEPTIE